MKGNRNEYIWDGGDEGGQHFLERIGNNIDL
ncbi:MAG: hypothetical protein ACI8YQ_000547 [Polaribacter sp.]|jgi:hypothetical protein